MSLASARDAERTFRTWLDLSRDEEVLVLFALVQDALYMRGYAARCEWAKLARAEKDETPAMIKTEPPAKGGGP